MSRQYEIYIDDLKFPVAPSSIETKINGKNETVNLINGGEFNLIQKPGLTEISMELRLPSENASYAQSNAGQIVYLNKLSELKEVEEKRVFSLMILRSQSEDGLDDGFFKYATLEKYSINEDVKEGSDILVSCEFKQFIPLRDKKVIVKENADGKLVATEQPTPRGLPEVPKEVTALPNDSLWLIAQKYLGDGERYQEIASLNKISNPNDIPAGTIVRMP